MSIECAVSLEPVPAMTGIVTASATARHSATFSSSVSTELSPVEPLSTSPSLPCAASQRASSTAAGEVERPVVVERGHHGGDHPPEAGRVLRRGSSPPHATSASVR